jgi:hypothetical protein
MNQPVLVVEIIGGKNGARSILAKNIALSLKELGYEVYHEDVGWKNQKKVEVRDRQVQLMLYKNLFD